MATTRIPASGVVARKLRRMIREGIYGPGSQLPTEPELSSEFDTSRATLREALSQLSDEGLVRRIHGVGTFVSERLPIRNSLHVNFGVSQLIASEGMEPGTIESRMTVISPEDSIRETLQLTSSEEVVQIERVRTADGRPVVYSVDSMPARLIDRASFFIGDSVYDYLASVAGHAVEHGEARLRPETASPDLAKALSVDEGSLLFVIEQTDFDATGQPVLHSLEWHLSDAFTFGVIRRGPANT